MCSELIGVGWSESAGLAKPSALFPDCGVNDFPSWVAGEGAARAELGFSSILGAAALSAAFPAAPALCDREMDDICSLAAPCGEEDGVHTHTQESVTYTS